MNRTLLTLSFLTCVAVSLPGSDQKPARSDVIILDEGRVKSLRIQTVVAEPHSFETTRFALGRIETKPGSTAAIASPIPGRISTLSVVPGDRVAAGQNVATVESRQLGNPPPSLILKAPLSGIITRVDIRLGDPVEPDRALIEVTDLDQVVAVAHVPEHLVNSIPPEAIARFSLPALGERRLEGRLLRWATQANSESGTLDAYFLLDNPDHKIRPGLRVETALVVASRHDVLTVPRAALQGEPAQRFLYVKEFEIPHAFVKAPVITGESNDRSVEILSGLLPGDEVVTQGAYALAFAGGSSLSLKEALDAAHGHEHAADGSELKGPAGASGGDHDHAHNETSGHDDHEHAFADRFWMILSFVLMGALVAMWIRQRSTKASKAPKES
ncbi:MAG TPA: efflux RND transporter periplasmic adaptor subunit [Opitutaceae bacterium]|nr:efflux RND transporter periplasmic adaptor subunit [Opitutaceae bacterium]